MGGNGPPVVLEDADLDAAVAATLTACLLNAGQSCTAGERLLVSEAVHVEFRTRLLRGWESHLPQGADNRGPPGHLTWLGPVLPCGSTRRRRPVSLTQPHSPARKLHISLPDEVYRYIARRSQERGTAVSATIAEVIRREWAAERQERLVRALALDAESGVAFARAAAPSISRVISRQASLDERAE